MKFPYSVTLPITKEDEQEQWCRDYLGIRWGTIENYSGCRPSCWVRSRLSPTNNLWHFKNESDAILFSLRWSTC